MTYVLLLAYLLLNVLAFIIYGSDKRRARKGRERTPEATLLLWALVAAPGSYLGMKFFHHKTRKTKFLIVPILAVVHIIVIAWLWTRYVQ
ncbi:MAG: hypothetical protein A4E32_01472 [Methanomassiliicoccales archaeon PtaU1.Bin124]|nr:MAG: hypothetical protein A4E32_01472 [Methanomassiliicoccales archaeon PtaU1.Bin124]